MTSRIRFELAVPAEVREDGDHFVSSCPPLDVYSQGPTEETALENLVEALQLFVESCYARGTLDRVLKDCGFEPDSDPGSISIEEQRLIHVPFPLVAREQARAD